MKTHSRDVQATSLAVSPTQGHARGTLDANPAMAPRAGRSPSKPGRTGWVVLLAAALSLLPSIASAQSPSKKFPWFPEKKDKNPPSRVVAIWTEAVMTRQDGPAIRGFGGRLMFYPSKGDKPIEVQGLLSIYAFDESQRKANEMKPDRKFVFTPEQLARHYSKSDLGHSYSVWLPWDEVGGVRKEITLIARFLADGGNTVIGEPTKHLLPGREPLQSEMQAQTDRPGVGVQQASFNAGLDGSQVAHPRAPATTIPVPTPFGRTWPTVNTSAPVTSARMNPWQESARTAAQSPSMPASTRYSPLRPRALGEPIPRLVRDRDPWQPPRAGWQSHSEQIPPAANGIAPASTSPTVPTTPN